VKFDEKEIREGETVFEKRGRRVHVLDF